MCIHTRILQNTETQVGQNKYKTAGTAVKTAYHVGCAYHFFASFSREFVYIRHCTYVQHATDRRPSSKLLHAPSYCWPRRNKMKHLVYKTGIPNLREPGGPGD